MRPIEQGDLCEHRGQSQEGVRPEANRSFLRSFCGYAESASARLRDMQSNKIQPNHASQFAHRAQRTTDWFRRLGTGIIALAVLALALRAQVLLQGHTYIADGVLLYGLAAAGFLWAFRQESCERPLGLSSHCVPISPSRWRWAWAGGVMCLSSVHFFGGNRFRPLGVLLWLGGGASFFAALDDGPSPARMWTHLRAKLTSDFGELRRTGGFRISWTVLALAAITLLGAFLRFYRLDELPSDMTADIGHLWVDTETILRGDYLIFSTIHPGREIMMFYLTAGYVRLFGHSYFAHKAVAALIGIATILIVYLLGREFFDRQVGLLGAFFLAVARWHVTISRIGWRLVLAPPLVALLAIFLARAFHRGRRRDWLLGGLCLGFGLYTYNASRSLVPAVVLVFAIEWLRGRGHPRLRLLRDMGFSLAVALLAFVPLGRFALENPERFWFRILTRISSHEVPLPSNPVWVLLGNVARTALMFNYRGDSSFPANIPSAPQFDTLTAALLVLGSAHCLWRWRRSANFLFLVLGGAMLFTGALSVAFPHEVPSSGRSSGVLPFTPLLSALALILLARAWRAAMPATISRVMVGLGVTVLILVGAYSNYSAYFRTYPSWLPHHNYPLHHQLTVTIDRLSGEQAVYLKFVPYWIDGDVVRLQLQSTPRDWNNIQPELDLAGLETQVERGFAVILHPQDVETLETLRNRFSPGTWYSERMPSGEVAFRVFLVGPTDLSLNEVGW